MKMYDLKSFIHDSVIQSMKLNVLKFWKKNINKRIFDSFTSCLKMKIVVFYQIFPMRFVMKY